VGDSDPGRGRLGQRVADTVACQSAASSPGVRVIEHILGMWVRLRSINMGRHRRLASLEPGECGALAGQKTITVERDESFVNRCGRSVLIEQSQRLLLLSKVWSI
jgi:hypothetical protein